MNEFNLLKRRCKNIHEFNLLRKCYNSIHEFNLLRKCCDCEDNRIMEPNVFLAIIYSFCVKLVYFYGILTVFE